MCKLIELVLLQTFFLAGGQVLLKLVMVRLGKFEWTMTYLKTILTGDFRRVVLASVSH